MNKQSAFINEESHEKIVKENEEEKLKELKKELKRKRNCERQRAYYHRQKNLKKNEEKRKKKPPKTNAERQREFRQRKAEKSYVNMKRRKLCSNEENVMQDDKMEADPLQQIEEVIVKCEVIELLDDDDDVELTPDDGTKTVEQNTRPQEKKRGRRKKPIPKNIPCEVCAKPFGSNAQLKTHMLTHTGERPHVCAECGKAYRQSHHLKTHEMSHGGLSKNFTCAECGATFTRKSSLNVHSKIHTGLKPHTCPVCSKSFVQKINLVYHIKVHEGDRKFECEECHKKFMTRSKLKEHSRKHAKKKMKQALLLQAAAYNSEDESPTLVSTSPLWGSAINDDSIFTS